MMQLLINITIYLSALLSFQRNILCGANAIAKHDDEGVLIDEFFSSLRGRGGVAARSKIDNVFEEDINFWRRSLGSSTTQGGLQLPEDDFPMDEGVMDFPDVACPVEEPFGMSSCNVTQTCTYGEECCCGECQHSYECSCVGENWLCMATDFCFRPGCKSDDDCMFGTTCVDGTCC